MRPISIPRNVRKTNKLTKELLGQIPLIIERFEKLKSDVPLISIVIPAYNEEENILKTLYSLSLTNSEHSLEIIVVDNNSVDNTKEIVLRCNVVCISETKQGITFARNRGLAVARGEYLLNADADTIYPPSWIDDMINPLIKDPSICLTYGQFSFIPLSTTPRLVYFFYEYASDINKKICKMFKEEALNVYGFNSACRRLQCLQVNGFNHPNGTNEDGWLAIKLREHGFGRLFWVKNSRSIVWTTDRRIQLDGGFFKATFERLIKNASLTHLRK